MKKLRILKISFIIMLVLSFFVFQTSASANLEIQNSNAESLVKLQIMRGDGQGNLNLGDNIKRCEFLALVIRTFGFDKHPDIDNANITFTDISPNHWSYNYIAIALKYGLITGYTDNTVRPDNVVSFVEAQAIVLRSLGFQDETRGKWPEDVINKSIELGLDTNLDISHDKQLTRGESSILIYNSLTVDFNKSK